MKNICIGPANVRDVVVESTRYLRVCGHLSLEVEQSQGLELNVGFGAQVTSQGARKVLQLLDTMSDSSLQANEEYGTKGATVSHFLRPS